ncbi:hypothetical protein ACTVZO_18015 [Streptomyces sp. IBSNAI002]
MTEPVPPGPALPVGIHHGVLAGGLVLVTRDEHVPLYDVGVLTV